MVAPTINDPLCQEQLVESAKDVAKSVEDCCHTCKNVCRDDPSLRELGQSAADVTRALNDLLNHVKDGHADKIPDIMEQIMTASGELIGSYDSGEMVRQARILAQSTAELIQAIKGEAETQSDSELQVNFYIYFTQFILFLKNASNYYGSKDLSKHHILICLKPQENIYERQTANSRKILV